MAIYWWLKSEDVWCVIVNAIALFCALQLVVQYRIEMVIVGSLYSHETFAVYRAG